MSVFPKLNFHRFSTFQGAVILQIDLSDGPEWLWMLVLACYRIQAFHLIKW